MNKSDLIIQKEGKAYIPAAWPSDGVVRVKELAQTKECLSKAVQCISAGTLSVHMEKDYDASGAKVYTDIHLPAAPLVSGGLDVSGVNEVPIVFDEIRETGTTVSLSELTIWI